jgi:hypothetical protein
MANVLPLAQTVPALTEKGYVQYSLVSAVTIQTAAGGSIPVGATTVLIVSDDNQFRWRDDGTLPTSQIGTPVAGGAAFLYQSLSIANLKLAPVSSLATLNLCFYG